MTVLANGADRAPARPAAAPGPADLRRERVARGGGRASATPVDRPEDADVALVRLMAPVRRRARTSSSSRGSTRARSTSRPGLVARLARVAAHCPLVVDVVAGPAGRPHPAARRWPARSSAATAPATTRCSTRSPARSPRGAAAVRPAALDGAGAPAPRGRPGLRRPAVRVRPRARGINANRLRPHPGRGA